MILELMMAGLSIYNAQQASSAADSQQAKADKLAADQLAFSQQQLADWEATYGGIEDNLSSYYNSLTADGYATQALQQFEQEKTKSLTAMRQQLAQRGLESSGLAADIEFQTAMQSATQRATIRQQAPAEVAKQQQSFLSIGMQRNPAATVQNTLNTQASRGAALADQHNKVAGQATASAYDSVGSVLQSAQDAGYLALGGK